ncbi:MAG: hypothetical protein ACXWZF_04510 [Actinomycetota bacterium]
MGPEHDDALIAEIERERDAAIARADDAEERERLALDRLRALAPLEARIEAAERRALDAERRLDEITAQVSPVAEEPPAQPEPPGSSEPQHTEEPDAAARQAADLRARLARTAARKKPTRSSD